MSEELAVRSPEVEAEFPSTLVALTPQDVAPTQQQLAGWCERKILSLWLELAEQRENLDHAKKGHWKRTGWTNAISKTQAKIAYYGKIREAVAAGYLVVPNFPVDLVAVRISGRDPKETIDGHDHRDEHLVTPQVLGVGEGRYVGPEFLGYKEDRTLKNSDGSTRTIMDFIPTAVQTELDFPFGLVKPVILDATQHALKQKIFDRVGVVRGSKKSDPIVVGQILRPGQSTWARRSNPVCVSFFVAWWLDLSDLTI